MIIEVGIGQVIPFAAGRTLIRITLKRVFHQDLLHIHIKVW